MRHTLQCLFILLLSSYSLASSNDSADWRPLDPSRTLYMELPGGRVIIELAPQFAPKVVKNIKRLVKERYFDNSSILRSQDNFVVQWGWPDESKPPATKVPAKLSGEFDFGASLKNFTPLPDPDTYADQVGFSDGFWVGMSPKEAKAWLIHCYGVMGVGRGDEADSGNGSSLYVVIGQSPRVLDRNITVAGRVIEGMELLSVIPRSKGEMGFYEKPEQRTPITSIRLASDLPKSQRTPIEIMRTDSQAFKDLLQKRRSSPPQGWFLYSPHRVGICNMSVPMRHTPSATKN